MRPGPSLRKSLGGLREYSAHHQRCYIPEGSLGTVLTKEVIYRLLGECPAINPEALAQMVDEVHSKALKVFATLILMESDGMLLKSFLNKGLCDEKLPLSKQDLGQDLREALGDTLVNDFVHRQYMFLAPIFVKGMSYDSMDAKYVLPFGENKFIGQGAFATVYKIQIHPSHQRLQASSGSYEIKPFARKEFRITPDCGIIFEKEKRVLQLLLQLNHPNIVPLLSTYSHDGHFNMIFPLADMTLHDYLRSSRGLDDRSTIFLFRKVYGLVEALNDIHNPLFKDDGKEFKLLGYHHDLKPRNILVLDGRFMIADFGLANLKSIDLTSMTESGIGRGAYSPPEAGNAGRAYDIWSLGCILAEFATFDVMEAEGVKAFAQRRTTQVSPTMANDYFHDGTKVKPEVLEHFRELKSIAINRSGPRAIISQILELVEQMLEPAIDKRLSSGAVLERLGEILDISHRTSSPAAPLVISSPQALRPPLSHVDSLDQPTSGAPIPGTNQPSEEDIQVSQMEAGGLMTKGSMTTVHLSEPGPKSTSYHLVIPVCIWNFFLLLFIVAAISILGYCR